MPGFGAIGEFAIGELSGAAAAVEVITVDKWFHELSIPSVRTKAGLAAALQMAFVAPAIPTVSFGWFESLSEPSVKTKPGLRPSQQMSFTTSPQPLVSFSWFGALSEPLVKAKAGLRPSQQMAATGSLQPFVSFAYFRPLSEPVRFKPGLRASLQMAFTAPPRLLPTPTITGTLNAIETGDTMLWAGRIFSAPVSATIGVIELAQVPYLGIVEMSATAGVSGVVEDRAAPTSGSPVSTIMDAAVGIRII